MKFDPHQRTNFLDLLRPPSGYRLDSAVGTTYSMDFVALTAVLLAFVDAEVDADSQRPNQVEVLRAITRLASRVRVFVNRGQITTGEAGHHGKLSNLFDRIVREVAFDKGCFHPKVWIVRFIPKATADAVGMKPLVRILCTSRNLTTSTCWEMFVAFQGIENGYRRTKGIGVELAGFLRQINCSLKEQESLLAQLQHALLRLQIDLPNSMEIECRFYWQWNESSPLWNAFPQRGTKALIVSPFVRASFLSRVASRFDHLTLVSTQHELDSLSEDSYRHIADGNDLFVVRSAEAEDGSSAMQLHAKFFICQTQNTTTVLLGSANASDSAWQSRNCEAMVAFSPGVSIDQFYQAFIHAPKSDREKSPLRGWIERYERQPLVEDETTRVEKLLDKFHKLIPSMQFSLSYDLTSEKLTVYCPNRAGATDLLKSITGHSVRFCPLSRYNRDSDLTDVAILLTQDVEFSSFRVADLSDFLLIEITHSTGATKRFVVMAANDFAVLRGDRDAAILNEFLTADTFRQFLRAILFDGVMRKSPGTLGQGGTEGSSNGLAWTLLGGTTLEEILQSCTEDASRIAEIDHLLQVFDKTKAADADFNDFREFWNVFQATHAEIMGEANG